jgi:hypothetical protein
MDPFHRFKLEASVLAALAILIARVGPQLSSVPRSVRWTHFGLVGIFSLLGISGPRFVIMFCLGHRRFVEVFTQPNVLGVGAGLMQVIAMLFGVAAAVLLVATMLLGDLNRKAYRIFRAFVLPCASLYPVVMVTASGTFGSFASAVGISYTAGLVLVALGCFTLLFYRSKFEELEASRKRGTS